MVQREIWINKLLAAWQRRSIIWLAGVRRAGKTFLCRSLENAEYFDCEQPQVRQSIEDPEAFLRKVDGKRIVLDEIHRLDNPSELLKLAADYHPTTQVVATGSSTLGASRKFSDTLTGRKTHIHLTPLLYEELAQFDGKDLEHRLLRGGLPPFFLQEQPDDLDYEEWLASYWAKDIQHLFQVEKRHSFMKFAELLLAQSGSMFEASRFAAPCEASRPTIASYLSVFEATYMAYVIRPFSTHQPTEIVSAPKVYGFDTGFVCHARGWNQLRREDLGLLWEHLVLTELRGQLQQPKINYWRDKHGHEIDFILAKKGVPIAIECKWNASKFDPANLRSFRRRYPIGSNYVVAPNIERDYERDYGEMTVHYVSLPALLKHLGR